VHARACTSARELHPRVRFTDEYLTDETDRSRSVNRTFTRGGPSIERRIFDGHRTKIGVLLPMAMVDEFRVPRADAFDRPCDVF
jgi:hypothetical protein